MFNLVKDDIVKRLKQYLYIILLFRMPVSFHTISKSFASLFLSLLLCQISSAQPPGIPVSIPLTQENFSLSGFSTYALAGNDDENVSVILTAPFYPLKKMGKADNRSFAAGAKSAWIRFSISNGLLRDTFIVLKVEPYNDRIILYEQVNGGFTERGRSGRTLPVILLSIPEDDKRIRIRVKAGETQVFLLAEKRSYGTGFSVPDLQSEAQAALEQIQDTRSASFPRRYFFILLAGFHLSIFCFSFIKYYSQKKDKAYFFYSLSNGCTFFIYLLEAGAVNFQPDHWNNLKNRTELSFVLNIISTLLYVAFQNELLQFKTSNPRLLKCIKVYAGIVLIGMTLTLISNQMQMFQVIQKYSLLIFQTGQILGAGAVTYITRKQKGFYKYIFYGSISLLIGCFTFVFLLWSGLQVYLPSWFRTDIHIVLPAIAIDVLFFLMALVYRDKQVESEKIRAEQQLVEQLKQNKILQDDFTRNLEGIVKEKTEQLIKQRAVLEEEREAKLIAEFEQKFSGSELKALRSQINPHFIFNVLNTIESYALQNNREAVSSIIQKFSKLTRLVLENSLQLLVPIAQDLDALR